LIALLFALLCVTRGRAANGLKTIGNPGGGQIVYGPVVGPDSLPQAMGIMLREIHQHFGERPQVGRYFQPRGSDSIATFFTVIAKAEGNKPYGGLVIVSMAAGGHPEAALIYDQADRFGTTANPMLSRLNEVWHPEASQPSSPPAASSPPTPTDTSGVVPPHTGAPQPLQTAQFPDGSGTIGLPAGWQIVGGGGGAVQAAGPNGERINLGMIQQIYDPSTPQGRQMAQYASMGGRPSPADIYPYTSDLVRAFMAVAQQNHQKARTPVPSFNVTASRKVEPGPYETDAILVLTDADMHDGKEPLVMQMRLGAMKRVGPAAWSLTINQIGVPKHLVDQEWATMGAIFASWRQNSAVIQQQTQRTIDNIHAIGERSKQAAAAADAARISSRQAYEARSDSQARSSQNFSNYLLDQTVVQNTQTGEHGTVWNQYADSLVKNAPDKYQYVPSQDMMKGIDY